MGGAVTARGTEPTLIAAELAQAIQAQVARFYVHFSEIGADLGGQTIRGPVPSEPWAVGSRRG